jgi:hypothetical protein
MQVGFSSLVTDLIVKTFLYLSSLYSNLVLEVGIFSVVNYHTLLLVRNEKLCNKIIY